MNDRPYLRPVSCVEPSNLHQRTLVGLDRPVDHICCHSAATRRVEQPTTSGRLFPGVHEEASISRATAPDRVDVHLSGIADDTGVTLSGPVVDRMPPNSVFADIDAATAFFARDSVGWSVGHRTDMLEGVELVAERFALVPLGVEAMRSTFFTDPERFPAGSARFDSALLMRRTPARWRALSPWRVGVPVAA